MILKIFYLSNANCNAKSLYNTNSKKKKNHLINVIKSGLSYLKDEIKEMSEDEIKIEKPFETVNTVEKIPEFNRKTQKDKD